MSGPSANELLRVEDLHVSFATRHGLVRALRGVDLTIAPGETLGIVGESGSGKSVTALAALRLLDRAGRITGGRILWRGEDIAGASQRRLRGLRGAEIAMIFQNPRAALNPIRPVGLQIADALRSHRKLSPAEARAAALEALRQVRIREPERRLLSYPHELSGGMCQRVMIAMAMACEPALLIADEPTTGLDVTTQKAVMDLLAQLTRAHGMAQILITHDLALAAQYCQRVMVMEQGKVVETAPPAKLFSAPGHPYTRRLVAASPTATSTLPGSRATILGPPLLEVSKLSKRFADGTLAVDDVSFSIAAGESLGLVGESGSGKTTISRLVCRLMDADAGDIRLDGAAIGAIPAREFHRAPQRRLVQIVFQDAGDSLNPRFTAFDAIADPLRRLGGARGTRLAEEVEACAARAGLGADLLSRYPHQLSGGQKARVGIARALVVRPKLLVLDEPTAALDVSVQAVILELLDRLRAEEGLAYLFVSHDLNVVRMLCARLIVLQTGRIVEQGDSQALFRAPQTPYTAELVASIPQLVTAG
ncbi:MAG TPA: ABC transporter ATP-binding protein [Stellaceae bacterium]|nr:ABC transporter ATP-binding protein [Stellaceae bacterium]